MPYDEKGNYIQSKSLLDISELGDQISTDQKLSHSRSMRQLEDMSALLESKSAHRFVDVAFLYDQIDQSNMFSNHFLNIRDICTTNSLFVVFRPINPAGRKSSKDKIHGDSLAGKTLFLKGKSGHTGAICVDQAFSKLGQSTVIDVNQIEAYTKKNHVLLEADEQKAQLYIDDQSEISHQEANLLSVAIPRNDLDGNQIYGIKYAHGEQKGMAITKKGEFTYLMKDENKYYVLQKNEAGGYFKPSEAKEYIINDQIEVVAINDIGHRQFSEETREELLQKKKSSS